MTGKVVLVKRCLHCAKNKALDQECGGRGLVVVLLHCETYLRVLKTRVEASGFLVLMTGAGSGLGDWKDSSLSSGTET